ncbi:helix-turn-helix domain-containing protein [Streptomyces sp. NPDC059517]|uniref:helix-turn-helix domain-containing protein n=1 Tax=Streptomyces sp. NPDC059517 TaxID=3346855 RepID=UPI0036C04412
MDKQELGAFLRSRRERLRPEDVGMPSGPRRRTPGLRREEVAVLAHISTEYYVRLEQGRAASRPSAEVLAGIAGALLLTDAESDHLHVLAGTAPSNTRRHRRDVRPSILALLERLPQTAGFVLSATFEVLAWNDLAAALMEDFAELTPRNRNLARRAFLGHHSPGSPPYGVRDLTEFRHQAVMSLRSTLARYPADPAVTDLIDELREGSTEFATRAGPCWPARRPTTRSTARSARVEHVIGRMKNYKILRDCRQHGDDLHDAVQAVAHMHNLALTS